MAIGRIIKISVFIIMILLFAFLCHYVRNINIFEPVSIDFSSLSVADKKNISIYSISPLNRKTFLNTEHSGPGWNIDNDYHKNIGFILPDSIVNKSSFITVTLNGKKHNIPLDKFILSGQTAGLHDYLLPDNIKSQFTLYKLAKILMHNSFIKYLIIISLCLLIVFKTVHLIVINKDENFSIKLKKLMPWLKTILYSIIIAACLFFGYLLFKFSLAAYITSILLIYITIHALWLLSNIILKKIKASAKTKQKVRKILITTGIVWFGIETILRIIGLNQNYNEKNDLYFISGYNINTSYIDPQNPWVYAHHPYASYTDKRKEFFYKIAANNEGLRDTDRPTAKPLSEYRIICLGNSFTEGIGAPQDSTWPALLEDKLKRVSSKNISAFNAGISSSDPFFEYYLLEKKLLKYAPDLVLLALNTTDFEFYNFRGGFERFTANGIKFRNAPCWEKLYATSYIFRFYINNLLKYQNLISPKENEANYANAQYDIYNCILKFYNLSLKNKFQLVIVLVDDTKNDYFPIIEKLKQLKTIPVIDLFEYNKNIADVTINNRNKYYWEVDGHCNSNGYNLFAEGVLYNLMKMGTIDSINSK